jgi:glycosyltransferase involved in cell wall biosynthesis
MAKIVLYQTIVPDYRVDVLRAFVERSMGQAIVACGDSSFSPTLQTSPSARSFVLPLGNRFSIRRSLLWQSGLIDAARDADLVIGEFCLRAISTWRLLAVRVSRGLPTIFWGHESGKRQSSRAIRRWMLKRSAGFIAYTESQRATLQDDFPFMPVWVAANATMWRSDCVSDPVQRAGVSKIIYVGRLIPEKKPMLLVAGFIAAVSHSMIPRHVKLVMVGEGPELPRLRALVATAGVSGRVDFLGHVSDVKQLRSHYSRAFVAVSPGYVGLSVTQALSFGVPMLVADREPHSPEIEACRAGENMRYFRANDATSLASALREFWYEREIWIRRRPELSAWTGERYSYDRMLEAFEDASRHFLSVRKRG